MSDTEFVVIFSTCNSIAEADRIAKRLIEEKTAACVNISDRVTSVYRWDGEIQKNVEALIIIKTRRSLVGKVQTLVKEESTYDCPEILAVPVVAGSPDYLRWLEKVTE